MCGSQYGRGHGIHENFVNSPIPLGKLMIEETIILTAMVREKVIAVDCIEDSR